MVIDMTARNEFGRFVTTTGTTRYKSMLFKGHRIQKHNYVWNQHFGQVPPGFIVHHINGNSLDNRINNLAALDITMHNRIHAHVPWNKGIKAPKISKGKMGHIVTNSQIKKVKKTWKNKYIKSMKKIHEMCLEGIKHIDIAKQLNLPKDQVSYRHSKYRRDYL